MAYGIHRVQELITQIGAVHEKLKVLSLEGDGSRIIDDLRKANTWVQIEEQWDVCRMYLHLGNAWLFATCLSLVSQVMPQFRVYCANVPSDDDTSASLTPPVVAHQKEENANNATCRSEINVRKPSKTTVICTSHSSPLDLVRSSTNLS
ncbi:uncharacterized protein ARMOST_12683 [Armillaria ostoyae]|uniref:Uncharacterized protein n=1 Tax=Armillaria ostoyae TaxID=47428 RepID=A0A284RKM2_ARMOS|nr:uncharacterized protein ARMOST_12683 [Armillaria ostoyae]